MKIPVLRHPRARHLLIGALAVATAAGVVAGREKPAADLIEARPARMQTDRRDAPLPDIDLSRLARADAAAPRTDPFAPKSFAPAPKPSQAAAPAAPSAPPLPFRYVGRLTQDGRTEVYVLRGDELVSIAAGQTIDAQYRVDSISEARIAFTYLPLKTRQSLELAEAGG